MGRRGTVGAGEVSWLVVCRCYWIVVGAGISTVTFSGGGACLVGCFVGAGLAARFLLTARAGRSVGLSSMKVSSTFTCFISVELRTVHIVLPLNWELFKAFTKVAGSS